MTSHSFPTPRKKVVPHSLIAVVKGMTEADAVARLQNEGYRSQIWMRDGQPNGGTADYRVDRLKLSIEDGKVVGAEIG